MYAKIRIQCTNYRTDVGGMRNEKPQKMLPGKGSIFFCVICVICVICVMCVICKYA